MIAGTAAVLSSLLVIALLVPLPSYSLSIFSRTQLQSAKRSSSRKSLQLQLATKNTAVGDKDAKKFDATTSRQPSSIDCDAQALLELLLEPYRQRAPDNSKLNQNDSSTISSLITRLSEAQVEFDPAQCLNGPLYAVLYQRGPKVPRWEKLTRLVPKMDRTNNNSTKNGSH